MKVELLADDLHIIKQSLETMTIQGKDAKVIGILLEKIEKAFSKEVEKQNG